MSDTRPYSESTSQVFASNVRIYNHWRHSQREHSRHHWALQQETWRPRIRGAAVGLYSTFGDIGAGLAPLTAYSMASVWGLQPVYTTCAVVLLICLMAVARGTKTKMLTD